jgi:signal transduction histidine kinase
MSPIKRTIRFCSSFQSLLFLIFTILTGVISAVFIFVLITGEIRNFKERTAEKAQLLASLLAGRVTLPLYSENVAELERLATEMLSTPRVARISISNNENRKLVEISAPILTSDTTVVTSSAQVIASSTSPSAETALSGVLPPISTPLGSVSVFVDISDMYKTIRPALLKTGGIVIFFWMAVVAACYPILKRVTRSFNTLTDGLNSMMEGNFSAKIIIDGEDEAGKAAKAVNRLAIALEERETENHILQEELVKAMRLEAQEERRKIMAKLIQTNRMTSLGLLISSIAHNINTPNGAIKLAAQHLSGSWKDALPILEEVSKEEGDFNLGGMPFGIAKGEIKGAIDSILNNASRVERVIQDLRAYNVGERSELSPGVVVNRVVEEALTIIRAHGRQGEISISPILAQNLPCITGNQYQLEQVVVNLLLNAMQAMPNNKGVVLVQTEYSAEASEVRIIVSDQGEGIPPESKKFLFEAFFSTKLDRGGSGLGLYISNFIVSEHKGRLTVEPGKALGTVATIYLPVTENVPGPIIS